MRFILLSALILLFYQSIVHAQGFAPIGAEWVFTNEYCFFPHPACGYYKVTAVADTVFDNQIYSVLKKKYLDSGYSHLDSTAYVTSVGDSVFTYNPSTSVSNLLYDFSRVTGDTIVINDPSSGNIFSPFMGETVSDFRVVVDSTDAILVNGMPLRVQYTSPADTSEMTFLLRTIERIGNVQSLFGASSTMLLAGYYGSLVCYSEPDFHFGQPIEFCGLITGLKQIQQIESVSVYPNPTLDYVRLTSSADTPINLVEVFDIQGNQVLHIQKPPSNGVIELSNLHNGLYIMFLHLPNSIYTTKIIKL
jgi:hypothetical protein